MKKVKGFIAVLLLAGLGYLAFTNIYEESTKKVEVQSDTLMADSLIQDTIKDTVK